MSEFGDDTVESDRGLEGGRPRIEGDRRPRGVDPGDELAVLAPPRGTPAVEEVVRHPPVSCADLDRRTAAVGGGERRDEVESRDLLGMTAGGNDEDAGGDACR